VCYIIFLLLLPFCFLLSSPSSHYAFSPLWTDTTVEVGAV
jgi:hypothetical protein